MFIGVGVHLVTDQDHYALARSSFGDFFNPFLSVLEGLSIGYVINNYGSMGISDIHPIESHSLLVSRDVPDA
jgi:hypothetical protein